MMTALKEYAEPYDWVVDQLKDWAYMVSSCYFFYKDGFIKDLKLRVSMQEGMEAYGGVAQSYIILLREKPTLWWHFHSLHQCIHLTLSFMLADENNPIRMCKYCKKIYLAGTTEDEWFCSENCKNAYEENGDQQTRVGCVAAARRGCDIPFCSPGDAAPLQKSASQIFLHFASSPTPEQPDFA